MDRELLKRACEVAGVDVAIEWGDTENGGAWGVYLDEEHMMMDHPALPSYVASLLVAKVRGSNRRVIQAYRDYIPSHEMLLPTDEQRIRAALYVLEDK